MSSLREEINALANAETVSVGLIPGYATACAVNHPMAHHNWWYRCGLSTNESRHRPSRTLIDNVTRRVHAVADISRYRDRGAVVFCTDRAAKPTRQTEVRIIAENLWTANKSIEIASQLQVIGRRRRGAPVAATPHASTLVAPSTPNQRRRRFGRDRS
jgi:hypothetical protein